MLFHVVDIYGDILQCQPCVRHADKNLSMDTFVQAVKAMSKLSKSKNVALLRQDSVAVKSKDWASTSMFSFFWSKPFSPLTLTILPGPFFMARLHSVQIVQKYSNFYF